MPTADATRPLSSLSRFFKLRRVDQAANTIGRIAKQVNEGYLFGLTRETLAINSQNPHPNGPLQTMLTELGIEIDALPLETPKQWASLARTIRKVRKDFRKTLSPFDTNLLVATLVIKSSGNAKELLNWAKTVQAERGKRQYLPVESDLIPILEKTASYRDLSSWLLAFDTLKQSSFWLIALQEAATPDDLGLANNEFLQLEDVIDYSFSIYKRSEAISHLLSLIHSAQDANDWSKAITESFQSLDYSKDSLSFCLKSSSSLDVFLDLVDSHVAIIKRAKQRAMTEMETRWQQEDEWKSVEKDGLPVFNYRDYCSMLNEQSGDNKSLVCFIRPEKIGEELVLQAHLFRETALGSFSYEVAGTPSIITVEIDLSINSWREIQQDETIWPLVLDLIENKKVAQTTLPWLPSHDSSPLNPVGARTVSLILKSSEISPAIAQKQISHINQQLDRGSNIFEVINQLFSD